MTSTPMTASMVQAFREDFDAVARVPGFEATAMTLATADAQGHPSTRTVLLKEMDERGFVFYTNLGSRKARHLRENPWAAITFHWAPLEKQVHAEGRVEPVTAAEADAYWATRPRESQLGGWASKQSSTLADRETFLAEVEHVTRQYEGDLVPRPPHWSGFRLLPERLEFWKGMPFRLHERVVHESGPSGWSSRLLYP